ncbi:MAG: response regulator [Salinivirgaceae bacterium]|nr:response regulator [Salinivirgaceae bacterium]MDY0279439.1 response regulator [Salinivirgaceae bacterium]
MLTPQLKNKKVLLVEDDKSNVILITAILQPTGIELVVAENGVIALSILKQYTDIDLILMDIQMPVMNGIETTMKIRETNEKIPIIAQTAFANSDDKAKCQQAGFTCFLAKPIDIRLLYDILWQFLG